MLADRSLSNKLFERIPVLQDTARLVLAYE